MKHNKTVTPQEQLSADLLAIASQVTYQNKIEWCYKNSLHMDTINRYLKGVVASVPLAKQLLADLKEMVKSNPVNA